MQPQGKECRYSHKGISDNAYGGFAHNSPELETAQLSLNRMLLNNVGYNHTMNFSQHRTRSKPRRHAHRLRCRPTRPSTRGVRPDTPVYVNYRHGPQASAGVAGRTVVTSDLT